MSFDSALFAKNWINLWNRRDVVSVLKLYHDDVTFISPTAMSVMGIPTIYGKMALRQYWVKALERHVSLCFSLDHSIWDQGLYELAIVYTSEISGSRKKVCEILKFDADQLVVFSEVFHGPDSISTR